MIARSRAVAAPGGRLIELACQPPLTLRQIAAVRPGVCALCLVGTAAGPLAGDDLTLRLEVLAGTSASLQAAGAAIAQGRTGGAASSLRLQAALGTGAALRADPGALIVRAGARIAAHVEIDLGAHAQVEWHELIFLDAHQTPREADRPAATLRWDVTREGVPLLRQLVDLTSAESFRDAFMLAGRRVLASALLSGKAVRGQTIVARPTAVAQQLADDTVLVTVLADDAATAQREMADLCDQVRRGCA